jgi:hypothetical protein
MKESQIMLAWQARGKWFWLSTISPFAVAGKWHSTVHTCRKECNKLDLTDAQYF